MEMKGCAIIGLKGKIIMEWKLTSTLRNVTSLHAFVRTV